MEKKHPGGRPIKWTPETREKILSIFKRWIEITKFPVIQTFCYQNGLWRQRLDEWPEFADTLKVCKDKAMSYLTENGIKAKGGLKPAVTIFLMKNIGGYRDTVAIEHSGAIDPVQDMTPDDRRAMIDALIAKRNADNG